MKEVSFARGMRTPSEAAEEVIEVDVTPVMNMFIILIPFLVSVAAFTQLSIISFGLPPNVGADLNPSSGKPKLKLTVVIAPGYLALTHGEQMLDSIGTSIGEYDLGRLRHSLARQRASQAVANEIVVASRDQIAFEHLVHVMDICREEGFEKIGVSSAVENPEGGI
jgi:biopolymer transport protein ExbD